VARLIDIQLIRRIYYPLVMATGLVLLPLLLDIGLSPTVASLLAATAAGLLVLAGEWLIPYRADWRPALSDVVDDGLFMLAVQVALPLALGWIVVLTAQRLGAAAGVIWDVWPTHWPIWLQVIAKIAIGDFGRYWLHRFAHEWRLLWRFHAVHHEPRLLYSLNVFRFHPADKALQFFFDSLPFILLGLQPEVLAYYFVFYATSGFFQHSNCDVRLGWLNYVISGPEVHRWHHSKAIVESNRNYANNFVLWDLLFASYFRPQGRQVAALGLHDPGYPRRFLDQMAAPFRRRGSAPSNASPPG
jgi:sterol desaturase/sphingolipid hydroxylase (fatty acid hydroxylase superfamily)